MSNFHFLFREDKGKIGRGTWWRANVALAVIWLAVFALYLGLGRGDITKVGLVALLTLATMMLGVCFYFVSAKRFQDIGRPGALALILPLMLLFDAAVHWMQPRIGTTFPAFVSYAFDFALAVISIWSLWLLGFQKGDTP